MKKAIQIKELDTLYDFRNWVLRKYNKEIYTPNAMRCALTIGMLDEYIEKIYPSIKKENKHEKK